MAARGRVAWRPPEPAPPPRHMRGRRVPGRGRGGSADYFQMESTHSGWSMNGFLLCWKLL
ncbi:hypothetical protein CFP59_08464 [Streptomyces malaysiensis subsp. malaysiensis]|nr:hypothetical protein CFP59_08464 [Streptomyces sp. M56]